MSLSRIASVLRGVLTHLWPRSMFGRLTLILFVGLSAQQTLSFGLILRELAHTVQAMMISYLAKDVATSVAVLERVPAAEREVWLERLARKNYRYVLNAPPAGTPAHSATAEQVGRSIAGALGEHYTLSASAPPDADDPLRLSFGLKLADGTPLTIELFPPQALPSAWTLWILLLQLAMIALFAWLAVRSATRPLAQLAHAADALGPDLKGEPLPEGGPLEVARAATAFNAMQRRIADQLAERMQMLAAISHDLQTPITRMRLRADLLDNATLREKLYGDLNAMQILVEEGIAYARSVDGVTEELCRTDLNALLDSLVCDYIDGGQSVRLDGRCDAPVSTRPHTLRRVLTNLIDNALKFAQEAEVSIQAGAAGQVSIQVRDRGPGIPPAELEAVLRPFYRVEGSRNRQTGGTGLGLAIAQQLTLALGGKLTIANRIGGGLEATLSIPAACKSGKRRPEKIEMA